MANFLNASRLMNDQEYQQYQAMQAYRDAVANSAYAGAASFVEFEDPAMIDVDFFADFTDQQAMAIGVTRRSAGINGLFGSPVPLGTQLGRWLGGVVGGSSPAPVSDDSQPATEFDAEDTPEATARDDTDENVGKDGGETVVELSGDAAETEPPTSDSGDPPQADRSQADRSQADRSQADRSQEQQP